MKKITKKYLGLLACLFLSTSPVYAKDYISSAKGYNGDIKVKVKISNNEIKNIEILEEKESSFTKDGMESIISDIIETQNTKVDNVAGATSTSVGLKRAIDRAVKDSGAKLTPKQKKVIVYNDLETDVVIIGGGGAGLTASIAAKENGSNVILIEKAAILGGNTNYATGGLNAAETSIQASKGVKDSVDIFVEDTMKGGKNTNDKNLVITMAKSSSEIVDWLMEKGADLSNLGRMGGQSVDRTHRPTGGAPVGPNVIAALSESAKKIGVDIKLSTFAESLIYDGQAIKGVVVKAPNGQKYTINSKAVIIASGGFGANSEMVVENVPSLKGFGTTNHKGATGDGISMIKSINVDLVDMEQIQTHPTVIPSNSVMITEAVRGNGAILVNRDGKRFINELDTRDIVSEAELAQKGGSAFLIFDESVKESLKAIDSYDKKGYLVKGSSIEELAQNLNIPVNELKKTFSKYNESVKNNFDSDFKRQSLPTTLEKAPFYSVEVAPAVHHTMGGIKINEKTEVLSNGKPIKGLFAAGEVTGGIHGSNRLGGNAMVDIAVFGKIAGTNASNFSK
ncbi:flavocytochrome c [uncultured Cetobacterium sp.]|uniref:flavocytochrome c n=1 Tax=uncultured Cetobacterium sp. TaxID=527638 RepID=UPI00262503C8|nr:flavocytochrome c [uncultured Cetobacterium sp.]